MTERDRFVRTLLFQPVDRLPFFDYGYMDGVVESWHSEGLPVSVTLPAADEHFGLDVRRQFCLLPVNTTEPVPPFPEQVRAEDSSSVVKLFPDGVVRKYSRAYSTARARTPGLLVQS